MNTEWINLGEVAETPVLADVTVSWYDLDLNTLADPVELTVADGLVLEVASNAVRALHPSWSVTDDYIRLRNLPFSATRKQIVVYTATSYWTGVIGGEAAETDVLFKLFAPEDGTYPVALQCFEAGTGDPIAGVELSVWDEALETPVVPLVRTTTAGIAMAALPPGTYKVFAFKAYSTFVTGMPYPLTVTNGPVTLSITVTSVTPALPTIPKITLFGWVTRPDHVPVAGAEVKLRLLNTPQITDGGAGLTRFEMIAVTDASGRFEMFPIGGITALVTCDATSYSRRGVLPRNGSLNWRDFAKETISEGA